MKKIIALVCALILFASCTSSLGEGSRVVFDETGIAVTYPDDMISDTTGIFYPYPSLSVEDGIATLVFYYYALTIDELTALNANMESGNISDEDMNLIYNSAAILLVALGLDKDRSLNDFLEKYELPAYGEEGFTEIFRDGDMTYYAMTVPEFYEEFRKMIRPDFTEEYTAIQSKLTDVLKAAETGVSAENTQDSASSGTVIRFETTDIDGNVVKSEDLFASHEVTMVNIWATWCGPCKYELPELGNLARSLAASGKDAAVIGICLDAKTAAKTCKQILSESKAEYLNLLPFADINSQLPSEAIPTTYFVSRDGHILTDPMVGVPDEISLYEEIIDSFLK